MENKNNYIIYSKHFTTWLCGLISADGSIGLYTYTIGKYKNRYKSGNVTIVTSEPSWASQIARVLEENQVSYKHILTHKQRINPEHRIDIYKWSEKQNYNSTNQWKSFLKSVEEYKLQGYIINRKYKNLIFISRDQPSQKATGKKVTDPNYGRQGS